MRFTLKLLYRNGIALTADELAAAPSYSGNLVIRYWSMEQGSMPTKRARLLDMSHPKNHTDIVRPLFEPDLIKMTDKQMILRGYEIQSDADLVVAHYLQYWALRAD